MSQEDHKDGFDTTKFIKTQCRHTKVVYLDQEYDDDPPIYQLFMPSAFNSLPNVTAFTMCLPAVAIRASICPPAPLPRIFLKIRINSQRGLDPVHFSTTIPATSDTYIKEVLERACSRWHICPQDHALLLNDSGRCISIPVYKTVADLSGQRDLILAARTILPKFGYVTRIIRDPTCLEEEAHGDSILICDGIVKGSMVPFISKTQFTAAYERFWVSRRRSFLGLHSEKILIVGGNYLHIISSASKATTTSNSETIQSYHMRNIVECKLHHAGTRVFFELIIDCNGSHKKYRFEAADESCNKIVALINDLMSFPSPKSTNLNPVLGEFPSKHQTAPPTSSFQQTLCAIYDHFVDCVASHSYLLLESVERKKH